MMRAAKRAALVLCAGVLLPAKSWAQSELPETPHPKPRTSGYQPITPAERVEWFFVESVGPESLLAGAFTAAIGTARDRPPEYGPHWDGFGKRYAMRFTGITTSNLIEAGLGAAWGEDPRYFRLGRGPLKNRIRYALVMTVAAKRRNGRSGPAYARLIAIPGNNFLSNTWRADGEATTHDALIRTGYGLLGRAAANAWDEFWPSLKSYVFGRH
jgi:hypothetical protein